MFSHFVAHMCVMWNGIFIRNYNLYESLFTMLTFNSLTHYIFSPSFGTFSIFHAFFFLSSNCCLPSDEKHSLTITHITRTHNLNVKLILDEEWEGGGRVCTRRKRWLTALHTGLNVPFGRTWKILFAPSFSHAIQSNNVVQKALEHWCIGCLKFEAFEVCLWCMCATGREMS